MPWTPPILSILFLFLSFSLKLPPISGLLACSLLSNASQPEKHCTHGQPTVVLRCTKYMCLFQVFHRDMIPSPNQLRARTNRRTLINTLILSAREPIQNWSQSGMNFFNLFITTFWIFLWVQFNPLQQPAQILKPYFLSTSSLPQVLQHHCRPHSKSTGSNLTSACQL